ncbi:MAG TPA: hypothetical protein VL691_12650 [Vicinamibacteria bacterium]|nr:hypothetical protein [Vicinamibacteria bacterium]
MRDRRYRVLILVLCTTLAWPRSGLAQEPLPSGPSGGGLAGSWVGWAKLTNDWPGLTCRYDGAADADSVRLELTAEGALLKGSLAIDLPAETGSSCPPLRKRYAVAEVTQGAGALSFTDSGGNEWNLSVRRSGSVLQGLLAWRQGGPEQPLAEGFTSAGGVRPGSRLSGEVRLHHSEEPAEAKAPEAGGAPAAAGTPAHTGSGRGLGYLGIVLGANVVGLGILYGVNKAGKGTSSSGVVTCSPRVCVVGPTINDPCYCEGNVVSGAPCGTTTAGAPINSACDGKSVPCEAALSCNSGVCQDRFGRCPY